MIDVASLNGDTVKFGATVTLIDEDTEAKTAYQLVGEMEADVKEGRLSLTAPLARALIGKEVGDSRSEEHTSALQSLMRTSYAVFCLTKTNKHTKDNNSSHKTNQQH